MFLKLMTIKPTWKEYGVNESKDRGSPRICLRRKEWRPKEISAALPLPLKEMFPVKPRLSEGCDSLESLNSMHHARSYGDS